MATEVRLRTLDGLHLAGTLELPAGRPTQAVVLVHGGGVTRHEAGFFTRLAAGLASHGVASLRFDLRGHGESEGRQEDLTLAAILNDIGVALTQVGDMAAVARPWLLGASFAGGLCAYYAARRPDDVSGLVLFNPLFDYRNRFIEQKPAWASGSIDEQAGQLLLDQGFVSHSPTFKLGRPLLNEVFWFDARAALPDIAGPTLLVHGTKDTFIPIESSRQAAQVLRCEHRLVELEGAQHGLAVHDDPTYADPQSQRWQASVIQTVADWITGAPISGR